MTTPELNNTDTIAPLDLSITGCASNGVFHALDAANGRQTPAGITTGTAVAWVAPVGVEIGVAAAADTNGIDDDEDGFADDTVETVFFATVEDAVDRDDDEDDRVVVVDHAVCVLACEWPLGHRVRGVPAIAAPRTPASRQITAANRALRERRPRAAAKLAARPPRSTCARHSVPTECPRRVFDPRFPRLFVRIINPCRPHSAVRQSSNCEF